MRSLAFAASALAALSASAQNATTLTLSAPSVYALPGQPVTLTAKVDAPGIIFIEPALNTLAGTVTFRNFGAVIPGCQAVAFLDIDRPRSAFCTITVDPAGYNEITAEYSGSANANANFLPSNSNVLYLYPADVQSADSPLSFTSYNYGFGAFATTQAIGLAGFTGTRPITISGGQYSVGCTTTYTTSPGTVQPGDLLCVRHVTPMVWGEQTRTTITIGTVVSFFDTNSDGAYSDGQDATIAAGISHTLVADGQLVGWGDNTGGKIGNGRTASTSVPTPINYGGSVVAAGLEHSLFVSSGQVYSMGLNTDGQLGDPAGQFGCSVTGETDLFPCKTTPRLVAGLDNVVGVSAGWRHSVALKSDGSVWAWGSGVWGQNGKTVTQPTPARVLGLPNNIVRISAGYMHNVALASDGSVWAWGSGQFGELGPGSSSAVNATAVLVAGISDVIDISAGGGYTLARKADGTVWSWGINIYGQLGDPNFGHGNGMGGAAFRSTPTQIAGLVGGVSQISAGFSFAFARRSDGVVYSWGLNHRGQANGTPQSTPKNCGAANGYACILSPTPVPGTSNTRYMYAGGAHAVLVDNAQRLTILGDNSVGQRANRDPNYGERFTQTTYDPDTILNPAGVGGTPANVGRPSTAGGLDLGSLSYGLSFGSQPKGVKSEALVLSLNNLSESSALEITSITASGDGDPAEFSVEHACPPSLLAGGSCLISVYFTPADLSDRTGNLYISSNATDSSVMQFALFGNGVDPRPTSTTTLAKTGEFEMVVGTPITFTASVTSTAPVSGTVTVGQLPGGQYPMVPIAGCADLPVVSGSALCTTNALADGYYQVVAIYSGSATVQPSGTFNTLNFIIVPPVTTYRLTVASVGGPTYGTGTVASVPAGINCVGCFASFPVGTVVTLTATPSPGSVFAGWTGDCSGTGTCVVTMSANRNVIAPFTLLPAGQASLTVAKAGAGSGAVSSTPSGINCGAICTANFATGTPVTLTATASTGSAFTGWSGEGCSGTGNCVVNLGANTTVTATFAANPPRLVNLSTRMQVGIGDNVLIGGLVIGGAAPKTVVIRARGPSLAQAGVAGGLANPKLDIYAGQTLIASNDNWGVPTGQAAAIQAAGFQPLDPNEAAVLLTLTPGGYTAVVSGVGNTTGIALIEAFEVDLPQVPLINIATRGFVQAGDNVMIGGFVILGDAPQTVILRARGPSLTQVVNIANPLIDPVLSLYSGQTLLRENDNWANGPQAAEIQSRGYAPTNASESAILVTLPPGGYTAIVSGASGGTGVALIEVFAVPTTP